MAKTSRNRLPNVMLLSVEPPDDKPGQIEAICQWAWNLGFKTPMFPVLGLESMHHPSWWVMNDRTFNTIVVVGDVETNLPPWDVRETRRRVIQRILETNRMMKGTMPVIHLKKFPGSE